MSPLVGVWVLGIVIFFACRIWKKRQLHRIVLEARTKGLTRTWGTRVNRTSSDSKKYDIGDSGIHSPPKAYLSSRSSIDEKGTA
jgi:hypothetical protein